MAASDVYKRQEDYHKGNRAHYGRQLQRQMSSLRSITTTGTELTTEHYHNGNRAHYGALPQLPGTGLATEDNRVNHNGNRARYGVQHIQPQRKQSSPRRTTTTETELATEDNRVDHNATELTTEDYHNRNELATVDNRVSHNRNRARY